MNKTESSTPAAWSEEMQKLWDLAEGHAYSVRQLQDQRRRLFETIRTIALVARFDDGSDLSAVTDSVEQSRSQFYQDIFCLLLNRGKRNGFFVEFGACDGLLISNTWLMETRFGWRGILSEPSIAWQDQLKNNRSCFIEQLCVWTETGQRLTFAEFGDDPYQTQSSVLTAERKAPVAKSYEVETISLVDMLAKYDAPKRIDFMSVDVEGGEYGILKAFPFDAYSFDFLCVEHLGQEVENAIKALLAQAGYRQVLRAVSGHDGFYIPEDLHPGLE